ncbi:hypothetical protein MNEG_9702 [Monoraphidium neglectum]|uniref:F-box domain-containing protein n=1 Tax=Monoraphidium neglectum TaxID=145388 RepID=A0A0D2M3W1_9CHLO|nr:hypothetical protein MNEG_9702 [Monoraphidium neglectum]KIY98259.1 hypothetical protein MNEG_9702 [Monoraphidium neglectum]|eukprot:XP_013897279.1 hypothetical protein MNEG_9702 [Monoraphidium neglectum]
MSAMRESGFDSPAALRMRQPDQQHSALDRLPDDAIERVVAALKPDKVRAHARLACKRLQAAVDADMRCVPLGHGGALPRLSTLAARFPRATKLQRHILVGEELPELLRELAALPVGAWPVVTCTSDVVLGFCRDNAKLLAHLARLCPNIEEIALTLPYITQAILVERKRAMSNSNNALHAWGTAGDAYGAVADALKAMPGLKRLELGLGTDHTNPKWDETKPLDDDVYKPYNNGYYAYNAEYSDDDADGDEMEAPPPPPPPPRAPRGPHPEHIVLPLLWSTLAGLTALEKLTLKRPLGAPGLQLASLASLRHLSIHFSGTSPFPVFQAVLHPLTRLTRLEMKIGHYVRDHLDPASVATVFTACPRLLELRLVGVHGVKGLLVAGSAVLHHLTRLELSEVVDVDERIQHHADEDDDEDQQEGGEGEEGAEGDRAPMAIAGVRGLVRFAPSLRYLSVDGACSCARLAASGHPLLEDLIVASDHAHKYGTGDAAPRWLSAASGMPSLGRLECCLTSASFPGDLARNEFRRLANPAASDPEHTFAGHFRRWVRGWGLLRSLKLDVGDLTGYLPLGDVIATLASSPLAASLTTLTLTAPSHLGGLASLACLIPAEPLAGLAGFPRLDSLRLAFTDAALPGGFVLVGKVRLDDARLRALLGAPRPVRARAPVLRRIVIALTRAQVVEPRSTRHKAQLPAPVSWRCCMELRAAHPGLHFEVE